MALSDVTVRKPASSRRQGDHLARPRNGHGLPLYLIESLAGQAKRNEVEAQLAR